MSATPTQAQTTATTHGSPAQGGRRAEPLTARLRRSALGAGRVGGLGLLTLLVLCTLTLIGMLVPTYASLALAGAVLVLAIGLTVYEPAAIPVLAMPALVIVERIGGEGTDLSFSDFALFGAFWCAILLCRRPFSPPMRTLLWLSCAYQAATLFTVLFNPFRQNTVEWFHSWISVAGALVVGWAVGRAGRAHAGLSLFLLACLTIALLTCVTAVQKLAAGDTGPVYLEWPFGMHKNFIGCTLAFAALVAYARPRWMRWPSPLALGAFWLCTLAIVASQARQALVGLGVGVLVVALRREQGRHRSKLILLAVLPALYFVGSVIRDQLTSTNQFNSAHQRLAWYQQTLEIWRDNPAFGVGLRWWTAGRTEYAFQPPNAELEVLSSAGAVGLAGFLILMGGALLVLWRLDHTYGTLAFALLLMRLVQGQFDLFWSAVVVSVPFLLIGVCLGAQAAEQDDARRLSRTGAAGPRTTTEDRGTL